MSDARVRRRSRSLVAGLLVACLLAPGGATNAGPDEEGRPAPTDARPATVNRVIDGSSLDAHVDGQRTAVAYLGAAAPSLRAPCGAEAAERNRELADDGVLLESDPAYELDERGLRLFYAFTLDGATLIDEALIREGLAIAVRTDARYGERLAQLQTEAAAAGVGCLWVGAGA